MTMRGDADLPLVPVLQHAPARFEPWPDEIRERCYELRSTLGGRDSSRTARLLAVEAEHAPIPVAASIRRWAAAEAWSARVDADLQRTHGRTLSELPVGWFSGLHLVLKTLLDGMAGAFDDLPIGGVRRLKATEITVRVIERAGLLALLPQTPAQEKTIDWDAMPLEEKEAFMRERLRERKRGKS